MTKIVVFESLALDGVMQAPGRPDEDPRDDFEHGGWATPSRPDHVAGNGHGRCAAAGPTDLRGLRFVMATYQPAA